TRRAPPQATTGSWRESCRPRVSHYTRGVLSNLDHALSRGSRSHNRGIILRVFVIYIYSKPCRRRLMPYLPISDYGIIGNMRTAALVGMNGSIDWYCSPNFDSPSIFGAILDDNKGGRFQIHPIAEQVRHKQFYWPSTNILITRFSLKDGIAEIQDFMPVGT